MNLLYGKAQPAFQCDKTKSLVAILCETILEYQSSDISAIDVLTKERNTYHEVLEDAVAIAKHFRSLGVSKGDVVALMADNSIHSGSYMLGALLSEAIFAPLNPTFTCYELEQICSWLQPKIIVYGQTSRENVKKVQTNCNFQVLEYYTPERRRHLGASLKIADLEDFLSAEVDPNDPTMIICSSGTTGLPKGVVHSNFSLLTALDYLSDTDVNAQSADVVLAYLPFYHLMGIFALLGNFYCGQKLVVMQKFKPQVFLKAIEEFGVNKMYIVPTVGLFLVQYEDMAKYDLSSLKEMICAGSMLSTTTYNAIRKKLPNADLRVAYGMSEINYTTITPPFCDYKGSVGRLMAGCVGKVIDPETAAVLPAYQTGELCIRSKSNFLGYYRNENETLNTMDDDGFVHTGDIVYYNEKGDVFVVDRIKDLIKHKGFQVSPVELEAILLKHESVGDVGVIGVPDKKCGELPRAFVVLRNNMAAANEQVKKEALQQELQDFVAMHVSSYKKLSGGVHFVSKIPKNSSGKILRRQLKTKYLVEE